jgi:membrane protein
VLDRLAKPRRATTVEASFASPESLSEPLPVHLARAKETGRGRQARSPTEIPWRGWLDIIWRTARRASEDRILAIAGGVVFYGLLALFPAMTALVPPSGSCESALLEGAMVV